TVKAKPYSTKAWYKCSMDGPKTSFSNPNKNPDKSPPFNPHRKATRNTGIIDNETDPPFGHTLNFKNGMLSRTMASAVKIAISISINKRSCLVFILYFPLFLRTKKVMQGEAS